MSALCPGRAQGWQSLATALATLAHGRADPAKALPALARGRQAFPRTCPGRRPASTLPLPDPGRTVLEPPGAVGGGTESERLGLNLSGSWQQGHSATYNTQSRI